MRSVKKGEEKASSMTYMSFY